MHNKNWFDRLFNPYDFAYAYAESDPVIEVKEEEEVNLSPVVFHFRVFRFVSNVLTLGHSGRQRKKAEKAAKEATSEAQRAKLEYDRVTRETNEAVAKQKAAYGAEKAEQERVVAESQRLQKETAAKALATKKHATAAVGHSKVLEQRKTLASQIAAQEALRQAKRPPDKTKVKAANIGYTTVKGPATELALGASGAVSKPPKVKPKLNI